MCFYKGDRDSAVDPDGWSVATYWDDWPGDYLECDDPLPEENHAALIGNVGSEVFLVGSTATFWGMNGYLYLGINDCTFTGNYYNTGEFRVVILVEREAVTLTKKPVIIRPEPKVKPTKK